VIERVVLVRFAPTTDVDGTVEADGTVDVADATVVAADATVVVTDGTVDVTNGTVVVAGEHGSVNDGANAKPPNNTNDATTTDNRPVEVRTHRLTITPAINKNTPATTTNDELPTSGKKHTPTAITKFPVL
jgi:hypothetical protein